MRPTERFEHLFRAHYGDVLAYAVRRTACREDAEDIAAETFSVAWRRLEEVPEGPEARLWLFGTARLVRLNHHRSRRRLRSLAERVRARLPWARTRDPARDVTDRQIIQAALEALRPLDREILGLHAWEQLSAPQIAAALETSTPAVWKRLQRARDRLAAALEQESTPQAQTDPISTFMSESPLNAAGKEPL